jgi:hypothetical protein
LATGPLSGLRIQSTGLDCKEVIVLVAKPDRATIEAAHRSADPVFPKLEKLGLARVPARFFVKSASRSSHNASMNTPKVEPFPDSRIREEIAKMMAVTVKLSAEQARFNAEYMRAADRWWVPSACIAIAFLAGAGLAAALLCAH